MFAVGISVWFFSHTVYWVAEPPNAKLCEPLSQVTASSNSNAVALRDEGVGLLTALVVAFAPPGDVSWLPTEGNATLNPFMLAVLPDHRLGSSSGKNWTGAPLQPTRPSLTSVREKSERTQLLKPMRCEYWPAVTGNPGNAASRLFSVSGNDE